MLTGYFDDSGTHDASDIVLLAGIFGTEWQLASLDRAWKKHIDNPLCGSKPPLKRFHMTECQNSHGEFSGWSRTETDYFCHELGTVIMDSGVAGYGVGCSRKDWDELVIGDLRGALGNPEGHCVINCFVNGVSWAVQNTFDPKMTFVFDNRPGSVRRHAKTVFDAFEKAEKTLSMTGMSFLRYDRMGTVSACQRRSVERGAN
jgi:hypothetical protein